MEDIVDLAFDGKIIRDVILDKLKLRIPHQMGNVGRIACNEVVDTDYGVPLSDEAITEMRTEETGSPGDYGSRRLIHSIDLIKQETTGVCDM